MADSTYILLLRGINVGGKNILKMDALKSLVVDCGGKEPRTYIQSGNCAFELENTEFGSFKNTFSELIAKSHGFSPKILLLKKSDFEDAIAGNPFSYDEGKNLHIWFFEELCHEPNFPKMQELKANSEKYHLAEKHFFLHAPDGLSRSKLGAKVEQLLGVPATARNINSVIKIIELANN